MVKQVKYQKVFTFLVLTLFAESATDVTMSSRQSTCNSSSKIARKIIPVLQSSTDFLCTSVTSDSPSQATQSNDPTLKTPVAAIVGSLAGVAFLVCLILGSVFIIFKRRKRYTDHVTDNKGNSSSSTNTMSSRAPYPLPIRDNTSNFQVTKAGTEGKIFSVEAETATTFPSTYKAFTSQAELAKMMPSRSIFRNDNVSNRFATQMHTIADTTQRNPSSEIRVESSSSDVYSQVNSSSRQFSFLTSQGVYKNSTERCTRSVGDLKSNSASFDPLYSRVVKVRSYHNNPTSTYVPDYVNVPNRSSPESFCHTSSKDLYSKVCKLPAKLSSSTMSDSQNTASQHVLPSLQIVDEEVYSQVNKRKQERKEDKAAVHQRQEEGPTLHQAGPLHKNLRGNFPSAKSTKFLTDDTKEVTPAKNLVPAPTTCCAPGNTSSASAAAERESGYNSLHFSGSHQTKPDLDPQYHHLRRPHNTYRF